MVIQFILLRLGFAEAGLLPLLYCLANAHSSLGNMIDRRIKIRIPRGTKINLRRVCIERTSEGYDTHKALLALPLRRP